MIEPTKPTPLSSHTIESLIPELISGQAVITDDGLHFQLESKESQAAFAWYAANQAKWTRNIGKDDIEALADHIAVPPENKTTPLTSHKSPARRTLHLKSIRAHRFAGLHRFGTVDEPPEEFYHEFNRSFTLIEGDNGSGKSSLQSAILWCLTSFIYRPQRPPEQANEPVTVRKLGATPRGGEAPEDASAWVMSPVTPLPSAEVLKTLQDRPLPLDTWVELTFIDDNGIVAGSVKRRVQRSGANSVTSRETGLGTLGFDPVAYAVGTRMPGLIPHIKLGTSSELGKAVAELIGIKPLLDLARHACRMEEKFKDAAKKEREAEIRELDQTFQATKVKLLAITAEHADVVCDTPVPNPEETTAGESLSRLRQHFECRQTEMLADARTYLGETFDYSDRTARQSLADDIGPAIGAIDSLRIASLPSATRLRRLAEVPRDANSAAEAVVKELVLEAEELAVLSKQPDVASRVRLYARVANWLREGIGESNAESHSSLDACPICRRALEGKLDEVTSKPVADHLKEHLAAERTFLEKTPEAWAQHALSVLRGRLHETLALELSVELPPHPGELIAKSLGQELFAAGCFSGSLRALKTYTDSLCETARRTLPDFVSPLPQNLPNEFSETAGGEVMRALTRLTRAIAFARWRVEHEKACEAMVQCVIGCHGTQPVSDQQDDRSLISRLSGLNQLVKNSAPIREALEHISQMTRALADRRTKEVRLARYAKAAAALSAFSGLTRLVDGQVRALMATLSEDTAKWRKELYTPSFSNSPEVISTTVLNDGSLAFTASALGSEVPAQHVSNASDLRASLLAFLLAYWQHLLTRRGGLTLFLLDEPQELLDSSNRRRLANTLPAFAEATGAQVVVTTSSRGFGRKLASAAGKLGSMPFDHYKMHPLRAAREHIVLSPFVESIEEKRKAFEASENENNPQPARDYVKDLRIYIETRLFDLLDVADAGLPKQPTLKDIMGSVRSRVAGGREAYSSAAFQALVSDPDLVGGSRFLTLLNDSHHGNEGLITYNEVALVKVICVRVRKLVEAAHEEYELWLRRDPREAPAVMPATPASLALPDRHVPIFADLAAFTQGGHPSEATQTEETFSPNQYATHAIYALNTHNFGFAAPKDSRALVDCSNEPVSDNRLVVALHGERVYARRIYRHASNSAFIVLASEAEDPSKRPPVAFLPTVEVRLLKVVGILFGDQPHHTRTKEEAALVDLPGVLGKVEVAFRVRGQSAIPLALPNQLVLGGACIEPNRLSNLVGALVAVSTPEGAAFKRVGEVVPGAPHVRLFEAVGGKGDSLLVRTEDAKRELYQKIPLMTSARLIVGVLHE